MKDSTACIPAADVAGCLSDRLSFVRTETYGTVSSTNTLLRQRAADGEEEGLVIIASSQTEGRGRKGRSFFSPDETGIYMSVLLRPKMAAELALRITTAAAVSVCRAIEKLTSRKPGIKWVNDIYIDGLKVCGILTETAFGVSADRLDYVILGIGVNALEPQEGFPEDIQGIAGSVFSKSDGDLRVRLAAEIINRFFEIYPDIADNSYAEEYRNRCIVPGQSILVIKADSSRPAEALAVDDECRLLVRYDDGSTELLNSGEISIRMEQN